MPDICWEDNSVKTGSNQVALSASLLDIVTEADLSQMNSSGRPPTRSVLYKQPHTGSTGESEARIRRS